MRLALHLITLAAVSGSLTGCCLFAKRPPAPEIVPPAETPTR